MAFLDSVKNLMKFNKNNETKQKNNVSTVEKVIFQIKIMNLLLKLDIMLL